MDTTGIYRENHTIKQRNKKYFEVIKEKPKYYNEKKVASRAIY
jgi:hypothetical protein